MCAVIQWILAFVGVTSIILFVLSFLKELLRGIWLYLAPKLLKQDLKDYGEWAVITGGSAGIGKCTAYQLAKAGLKIVLVSNELEELKSTVDEIKREFNVECCYVLADFTGGKDVYNYLWREIEDKDVAIFVNCAGIDGKSPCFFLEESDRNVLTMIALNMSTVIDTTYRLSNFYLKKKKGIVVNVSSMASFLPSPYFATYSACKRFVDFFSKALWTELEGTGVTVQSITPFFVNTRMGTNKPYLQNFGIFFPSCETYCNSWVMSIGKCDSFTGYWLHEVLAYGYRFCPRFLCNSGFQRMYDETEKVKNELTTGDKK